MSNQSSISFNLVDEPWIPVRNINGELEVVSLKEVLLNADNYLDIEDGSPLIVISLYRFLLAVLHRALEGPADIGVAKKWYKEGYPKEKIESYLKKWYDRFDLFHPEYPFYQNPSIEHIKCKDEWKRLTSDLGAYNTSFLFNETNRREYLEQKDATSLASFILNMLQHNSFALDGMIRRFAFRQISSPLVDHYIFLIKGKHLFSTLALNLVPYVSMKNDIPLWESTPIIKKDLAGKESDSRKAYGYTDLYTWSARSFFIKPSEVKNGEVSHIYYAAGTDIVKDVSILQDPMLVHRQTKKDGVKQLRISPQKQFWRDYSSLFNSTVAQSFAPQVVSHASKLVQRNSNNDIVSIDIYGLMKSGSGQKIHNHRFETYKMPVCFQNDEEAFELFSKLIALVEATFKELNRATWITCSKLLSEGNRSVDTDDIKKLRSGFPYDTTYWSYMEQAFHRLLSMFGEELTEEKEDEIYLYWEKKQITALQKAWHTVEVAVGSSGRALKALSKAGGIISKRIKELKHEEATVEGKE